MFIAEVPEDQAAGHPGRAEGGRRATRSSLDPVVEVVTPFEDTHYGTREMTVRDPDGRVWSLQAPAAASSTARRERQPTGATDSTGAPDSTAVRTALWRALHVEVDARAARARGRRRPAAGRARRRLARPGRTCTRRAPAGSGPRSWPGPASSRTWWPSRPPPASASTSSSAPGSTRSPQRRPDLGARLRIFEVDQPGTQAWKRRRLVELGFGVPDWLRLVPIDFETGESWWDGLVAAGFDPDRPAVVASTGVEHVPHQGGHRGHAAPARRARPRLHAWR